MANDPTAEDIMRVRYRLNTVGDTSSILSDEKISVFWKEIIAEIEAECGIDFDNTNELHLATAADGVATMVLTDLIGRAFEATSIQLGDLRVDEQGLNWNVGVFEAARNTLYRRYEARKMLLTSGNYAVSFPKYTKSIRTSLSKIGK